MPLKDPAARKAYERAYYAKHGQRPSKAAGRLIEGSHADRVRTATRSMLAQRARLGRSQDKQFVAIDSEGVSFGDLVTMPDGGQAQKQRTIFWGASSANSSPIFLDGAPYCDGTSIIEWLLSLPGHFGPSIFIWFGSSYDATQLFADMPFEKAWELQHAKPFAARLDHTVKKRMGRYVYWQDYAISYIKQKCLTIGKLKDRNRPRDAKGNLVFSKRIVIFDVFGFFQTSFLKAAKSIPGSMNDADEKIIEEGKQARGIFKLDDRAKMQVYTAAELRVLARMLEALRVSLDDLDLRLTRWQGAGSIAAALLKQKKANAHFHPIASSTISIEQEWAHHAFFGGRIECLKQGVKDGDLWSLDIRSAYPDIFSKLPSMADGRFEFVENPSWQDVEKANVLSMFQVSFRCDVSDDPVLLNTRDGKSGPSFYPFPYRDSSGRILFPPIVRGIYMAEEVRAAFDWIEYHQKSHPHCASKITLESALIFHPGNSELPFTWLQDMYDERRLVIKKSEETNVYDLTEKVFKLGSNSVYGKTAQSVGNSDRPPGTACPWYAAAITAGTRAKLLRAALAGDGKNIVAFQTDGIICTRRIKVLEGKNLGDWDQEKLTGRSVFIQPGIYRLLDKSKHRGIKADLLGTDNFAAWIDEFVIPAWERGAESISYPYRQYLTLGASVASEARFEFAGWWVDGIRDLKFNNLGQKRAAPILPSDRKRRARELVDTLPKPAFFHELIELTADGKFPLSCPHRPDWLDLDAALENEVMQQNEEIAMTNGEGKYEITF